jgi:hypothetical protein
VFTPPADGVYVVKVQDRFRSRGGPRFAYRLKIAPPPEPDFRLTLPLDAVSVLRGGPPPRDPKARPDPRAQAKLKIQLEARGGLKDAVVITAEGLPPGVTAKPLKMQPNQAQADLVFEADASAAIDAKTIKIIGTSGKLVRTANVAGPRGELMVDTVLLGVSLPTPFVIKGVYDMGFVPRGTTLKRKYKIERNGFEGPIEVSLADRQARHLQGVTGPTIVVPADKNEFMYEVFLPPWMETGRTSRTCVMGVGIIKDGGKDHVVSFSSVNQNEQLVAVVGPGELALELGKTSATAKPGGTIEIPVRIKRGLNIHGVVKLEAVVPPHLKGATSMPATIGPDAEAGSVSIRFARSAMGPFTQPLLIRATLVHQGRPIVAEASVDVQPE